MRTKKELLEEYLEYKNTGITYSWIDKEFVANEPDKSSYYANLMGYIFTIYYNKKELYVIFGRKKARKIYKKALARYRRLKNEVSRM